MNLALRTVSLIKQFPLSTIGVDETIEAFRVYGTECRSAEVLRAVREVATEFSTQHLGVVTLHRDGWGDIDLSTASWEDLAGEKCDFLIRKEYTEQWCYFLTLEGWTRALKDMQFAASRRAVWIAADFPAFASYTLYVSPWGGPKNYAPPQLQTLERPRRLVRDQSYEKTPEDLALWLLTEPATDSPVSKIWKTTAMRALIYAIPSEVRKVEGDLHIVFKGPRSTPILVENEDDVDTSLFDLISKTAQWLYSPGRDSEVKFTFLNYHLSLDWSEGTSWPRGLAKVLESSLASARDAYAYHLHGQAADSLKTMSDLRRSLQDDVAKVQQATRELLTALWRDFAVAGVVLALRSPSAKDVLSSGALQAVTLGAALLLTLSLLVTFGTALRFNSLAKQSRDEWRKKIYAFVPEDDWKRLVEKPLGAGRTVFWVVFAIVAAFYLLTVGYLLNVGLGSSATEDVPTEFRFVAAVSVVGEI
jgi:hypothetical protein